MLPFIIVGMPRTGSSLLLTTLRQHPEILAYSELFHPLTQERAGSHAIRRDAAAIYFDPPGGTAMEFLENWVWCADNGAYSAVGFKLFGDYLRHPSTEGLFVKLREKISGLHVVHVKRLNYLDVYVSKLMATKTGIWLKMTEATQAEQASEEHARLTVDPVEAEKFFVSMTEVDEFLEHHFGGDSYLPVLYEKLAANLQGEADRIFAFLSVRASPVSAHLKKQIKKPKMDLIENYDELFRYFANSRFAGYFAS